MVASDHDSFDPEPDPIGAFWHAAFSVSWLFAIQKGPCILFETDRLFLSLGRLFALHFSFFCSDFNPSFYISDVWHARHPEDDFFPFNHLSPLCNEGPSLICPLQ